MKPQVLIYPTVLLLALTVFLGAMNLSQFAMITAPLAFLSSLFLLAAIKRGTATVSPEREAKLLALEESGRKQNERLLELDGELASLKTQNASYAAALEAKKKEAALASSLGKSDEQAVIQFVRNMQERGRFLDFLMADIHALPDQQVGAVARVVHSGLKSLVDDYFSIQAISTASEGSQIAIPSDEVGRSYRLLQSASDQVPASGILVHKGWQARAIKLPQSQRIEAEAERRVLAFAEVDVKGH